MLLRKRDLHRLVDFMDAEAVANEVSEKLALLAELFAGASGSDKLFAGASGSDKSA